MGKTCILTDNAAQFTRPIFPGCKKIQFFNSQIELQKKVFIDLKHTRVTDFPRHVDEANPVRLIAPTPESIAEQLLSLYQVFDDIFILLVSRELHPGYGIVEDVVKNLHGKAEIHLLDTQSISIGEGQIVQMAAEMSEKNISAMMIEERLRETIPHVYTLICAPNFSYLHKSGFLDIGQAVSGEYLAFYPIFTLEDGVLNPVEKVKNIRNVIDYFVEFIDEFDHIDNISFIQPSPAGHNESKMIRQHVDEFYPETQYSEHTINPFLASLIGPQGLGIVITESLN
jgi:DegV family protein with EDD domain